MLNSDAIIGYNDTWTLDNPATPAVEVNNWGQPGGLGGALLSPRFARLQVQFARALFKCVGVFMYGETCRHALAYRASSSSR